MVYIARVYAFTKINKIYGWDKQIYSYIYMQFSRHLLFRRRSINCVIDWLYGPDFCEWNYFHFFVNVKYSDFLNASVNCNKIYDDELMIMILSAEHWSGTGRIYSVGWYTEINIDLGGVLSNRHLVRLHARLRVLYFIIM